MTDRMTSPWGEHAAHPIPRGPARPAARLGRRRRVPAAAPRGRGATRRPGGRRSWSSATGGARSPPRWRRTGPTQITDSYLARQATRANLARATAPTQSAVRLLTTQDTAAGADRRAAGPGAQEPGAAGGPAAPAGARRARAAPSSSARAWSRRSTPRRCKLFERILGPTRTSLAEKKARLDLLHPGPRASSGTPSPWPLTLRPARRHRRRSPAARSSTTRASSAPTASTSAPASSSGICRARAGAERVVDLGLRQRRGRHGRWRWPTPRPTCCSSTSRTRRSPPRRPPSGPTPDRRDGRVPGRRRPGGRAGRQRRPRAEQPAVPLPPGDDRLDRLADVHRSRGPRCGPAASCG